MIAGKIAEFPSKVSRTIQLLLFSFVIAKRIPYKERNGTFVFLSCATIGGKDFRVSQRILISGYFILLREILTIE